jgi:heptaprenyl diphosphate synthase
MHPIWDQYPDIRKDLIDVLKVIDQNITLKDKTARQTVLDLLHAGGKLLRPAFFLLMAKTGKNYEREQLIHVAASIEVLHMASLIHDDIIDEAETRRGLPTVATQFGQKYALYTGDYLFCVCFRILSKYASALSTIEFNTNSVEKILIGELDQMNSRYNLNMTVKQYLSQIHRKTAVLFSMSTTMGAELTGVDKFEKLNAKRIGNEIGMAFQILDDILDYTQNPNEIGKPALEDMKQGVYSLPLIYAMNKDRATTAHILNKKENIETEDVNQILKLIEEHNGIENSKSLAHKYTNKAIARLKKLPDSEAKTTMLELTEKLLMRTS